MAYPDSPPVAKKQRLDLDENEDKTLTNEINKVSEKEDSKSENKDSIKADIGGCERGPSIEAIRKAEHENGHERKHGQTHCREIDVGITEYISQHKGFTGVLKQRYSDFLVNEISLEGEVVRLTSTDLPPDDPVNTQEGKDVSDTIESVDIEKLKELLASGDRSKSVLIKVGEDKALRSKIHRAVADGFPGLDSSTITKDDQKYIEVKITKNKDCGMKRWPKGRGDYCRFVLYKENKDTMDVISLIAKQLRLRSNLFQYAGTKDKRAKTSQEVTVFKVTADKLQNNNKKLRNILTGNYRYVKKPLVLGQLLGNRFTIILRSVSGSHGQIEAAMTSLKEVGFINYYGMQRFGTTSVATHHIGRALLQSNWREAVELVLKPRPGDDSESDKARQVWWETRDCQKALKVWPQRCFIERCILQGLAENKDNFLGAMSKISRNTRLMYVHSYQSYVWNTMVSHRIRKHGLTPVVGDLVIPASFKTETDADTTSASADDKSTDADDTSNKPVPKMVDETNIGQYSIYDVVLPLPGYAVIYPGHDMKTLYTDLMSRDGLDCDNMRHKTKDYSLSGDYRHILVQPRDVNWTEYRYNDPEISLALSDLDRLSGVPEPQNVEDGKHTALKLEMTLPTSCYATMAIREVLKMDTSAAHMSTLNVT